MILIGMVNTNNQAVSRYRYDPWGRDEVDSEGTSVYNPLRYPARYRDWDSGLYYNRNRWYDSHAGRFISEDPIRLAGGINPYAYAGNSPVNAKDPFGLECLQWEGKGRERRCTLYELPPVRAEVDGGGTIGPMTKPVIVVGGGSGPGGGDGGRAQGTGAGGSNRPSRVSEEMMRLCSTENLRENMMTGGAYLALLAGTYGMAVGGVSGYYGGNVVGTTVGGLVGMSAGPVGSVAGAIGGAVGGGAVGAVLGGYAGLKTGASFGFITGAVGGMLISFVQCVAS